MIRLKKGQYAMWHPHQLNNDEIDFLIRKINAVEFLNKLEKYYRINYTKEDEEKYQFLRNELRILQELKRKLDIWTN